MYKRTWDLQFRVALQAQYSSKDTAARNTLEAARLMLRQASSHWQHLPQAAAAAGALPSMDAAATSVARAAQALTEQVGGFWVRWRLPLCFGIHHIAIRLDRLSASSLCIKGLRRDRL